MRNMKKMLSLTLAAAMALSLAACGGGSKAETAPAEAAAETAEASAEAPGEGDGSYTLPESVEIQVANIGHLPVEKDGAVYNFYKELFGFGITMPYIEWNGGNTYQEQINLRISSGEAPDAFIVVNGMEDKLIEDGAVLDLTDYLPEYAPNVWKIVPESVWNTIRANDPTGQGRIWYIPQVVDYTRHGALIRQDWLDALELAMPTTQEELVSVLEAFKTQDPNGNGIADELPTGGRAEARWMDYLFNMYGIAMFEGYPGWDLYNGELTYSAVTDNMRDALAFCADLYSKGLMDPETLLNDKAAWDGKVNSNIVGVFFQWPESSYRYALNTEAATSAQPRWAVLPAISAEGYKGFYQAVSSGTPQFVLNDTDDLGVIVACLTAIDAAYNPEYAEVLTYGVEGMHCTVNEAGEKELLPEDMSSQEKLILQPFDNVANVDTVQQQLDMIYTEDNVWAVDDAKKNNLDVQQYGYIIAGNGIPNSIYKDHEDIQNRTLYIEYASKIITGEWPIEKFDEFVERWYSNGGTEVTENARAWYASLN